MPIFKAIVSYADVDPYGYPMRTVHPIIVSAGSDKEAFEQIHSLLVYEGCEEISIGTPVEQAGEDIRPPKILLLSTPISGRKALGE